MNVFNLLIIGIGLSMDTFAVSVATGASLGNIMSGQAVRIALTFGFFQAVMPVAGWIAGNSMSDSVAVFNHWLAPGLLIVVGIKMITEAFAIIPDDNEPVCIDRKRIVLLAVATNIDALAVGLSFSFIDVRIIIPALVIGAIAFVFSFAGIWIGHKSQHFFEKKIEIAGGILLMMMGFKLIVENVYIL